MKNQIVFVALFVIICCLQGCQPQQKKATDVVISGGGIFPAELAGTWRENAQNWEFVIEKDGAISSAVYGLSGVRLKPAEETIVPMIMDKTSKYQTGVWQLKYSPETRVLHIEMVIDYEYVEIGEGVLEGNRTNVFNGVVSEDNVHWVADYYCIHDYIVHTAEGSSELSNDPDNSWAQLEFVKVE